MSGTEPPQQLPIGTRIRFVRKIIEPATGDHPAFLLAENGELGTVTGTDDTFGYQVLWDGWTKAPFGARHGEDFQVSEAVPLAGGGR